MNELIQLLAIANQAAATLSVVLPIFQRAHAEGRTTLTDEEKAQVRQLALDSEARLAAATQ